MARYIDADKIKSKLQEKSINSATTFINTVLIGLLDDEPTADVVEVVRCSQCKHLKVYNNDNVYAECEKIHLLFKPFETDTRGHFCGFGERKCDK